MSMLSEPAIKESYATHQPMLVRAVEKTSGPVLELGAGKASTPLLHQLCEERGRPLLTIETSVEWYRKYADLQTEQHQILLVEDWPGAPLETWLGEGGRWSVALVDHAPGDRRRVEILRLIDRTNVLVVHDTEPGAAQWYGNWNEEFWSQFQYRALDRRFGPWTMAISNTLDVTSWSP